MKDSIKSLLNVYGWDLRRFTPSSSLHSQVLAVLDHFDCNLVFDVGANIGQFAKQLRSTGFRGQIVSFEPLTHAHSRLSHVSRRDPSWFIYPRVAIGNYDGEIEINISGNSVSSSILPMLDTHSSVAAKSLYVGKELTPIRMLDSIALQYLSPHSHLFLKIDTQGFEWHVLDGASVVLSSAVGVLLELSLVPLYDGQKLWSSMIERMESEGFTLWSIHTGFSDPASGRTLQVDSIFIRNDFLSL